MLVTGQAEKRIQVSLNNKTKVFISFPPSKYCWISSERNQTCGSYDKSILTRPIAGLWLAVNFKISYTVTVKQ